MNAVDLATETDVAIRCGLRHLDCPAILAVIDPQTQEVKVTKINTQGMSLMTAARAIEMEITRESN